MTKAGRFRLRINARKLKAGKKYTVRVNATDSTGRATTFKKSFKRCKAKKRSKKKRYARRPGPGPAALSPVAEAAHAASFHRPLRRPSSGRLRRTALMTHLARQPPQGPTRPVRDAFVDKDRALRAEIIDDDQGQLLQAGDRPADR